MSKDAVQNYSKSIRGKLLNIAKEEQQFLCTNFRSNNYTVSCFKPTRIATMSGVFCHFNGKIKLNFMFFRF